MDNCYTCRRNITIACIGPKPKKHNLTGEILEVVPCRNGEYELTIKVSDGHIYKRRVPQKEY